MNVRCLRRHFKSQSPLFFSFACGFQCIYFQAIQGDKIFSGSWNLIRLYPIKHRRVAEWPRLVLQPFDPGGRPCDVSQWSSLMNLASCWQCSDCLEILKLVRYKKTGTKSKHLPQDFRRLSVNLWDCYTAAHGMAYQPTSSLTWL